jgi:predicted DNA-binding transcriptional regulator AlpA
MSQIKSEKTPKFIRLPEVAAIIGLGKSTIIAWEAQDKFPKAVRLSPTFRVWLESDVNEWILNKHREAVGN